MKKIIKKEGGFTLIEVVLVLAIGALIILMALLAFAGAQRSRRDTARVNLVGTMQAAIEQSASNTSGIYPPVSTFETLKTQANWTDPNTGSGGVLVGTAEPANNTPGVRYVVGGRCADGSSLGLTDTAPFPVRYAIIYRQDSNQVVCRGSQ